MFTLLYGGKGSLSQCIRVAADTRAVTGLLTWHKKPHAARAYGSGFDPMEIEVSGAEYVPPTAGQTLLDLTAPASLTLDFVRGPIEAVSQFGDLDQTVTVSAAHAATVALSNVTNPAQVKITKLDVAKGTFTGSFTLKQPNPFNATLPQIVRPVTFNGVLVPSLGKGTGYFLLPAISGPPANVTTSPMTSGQVRLTSQ